MPRILEIPFPTLVLACGIALSTFPSVHAKAAVEDPSPDIDVEDAVAPKTRTPDELMLKNTVDIATPLPTAEPYVPPREYFYPYRQSFTMRLGQATSSATVNDTNTPMLAGLQYQFTNDDRKTYEAGADLLSDGTGALSFARRWIFTRSRLRPYAKAGGGLLVKPSDGLAALVNFVNFRVDGAGGAEYLVRKSQSVRGDLEAAVSSKAFTVMATIGYVWAW